MEQDGLRALDEIMQHAEEKRLVKEVLVPAYRYLRMMRDMNFDGLHDDSLTERFEQEIGERTFQSYDYMAEYDEVAQQMYHTISEVRYMRPKGIADEAEVYAEFDMTEYRIGEYDCLLTKKVIHGHTTTGKEPEVWSCGVHMNEAVPMIDDESLLESERCQLAELERTYSKATSGDHAAVLTILQQLNLY